MDVSDKRSHIVVLDEQGEVVQEDSVTTRAPAMRKRFAGLAGARSAIEVGPHSPWLSRVLVDLDLEVIVANPRRVGLIYGNDRKSDKQDAIALARLARFDPTLLYPVRHRREDTQAVLAILRAREALVRARTLLINSVRGLVKASGGRLPKCSTESFHRHLDEIPELLRDALAPTMDVI
jgi:transposase